MKITVQPSFAAALLFALAMTAGCQHATRAPGPASTGNVVVDFRSMDDFTDFDDGPFGHGTAADDHAAAFRTLVTQEAQHHLRPGETLAVTFTDIDLAGDYLPSMRLRTTTPVRVIENLYPARIDLTFTLTDANGTVLKQGERALSNRGFDVGASSGSSGSLHYEREILRDWLRTELREAR